MQDAAGKEQQIIKLFWEWYCRGKKLNQDKPNDQCDNSHNKERIFKGQEFPMKLTITVIHLLLIF